MPRIRRAAIPFRQITATVAKAPHRVFTPTQLFEILHHHRQEWHLPRTFSTEEFVALLQKSGPLQLVTLKSANYSDLKRYIWGHVSPYQVALSVKKDAFLSHGTAALLHDITDQLPTTIYVNAEQSSKPLRPSSMSQAAIDRAFNGKQRTSKLIYQYVEWRIQVIAGKNTGRMEVGTIAGPDSEPLLATKLERTLVDMAVRPSYAGGPHAVLEAFRRAKGRASSNVLAATLKRFAYSYPYHQVLGFYMERAGYPHERFKRFAETPMPFKFYLTYGIKHPDYVKAWKLFIPENF